MTTTKTHNLGKEYYKSLVIYGNNQRSTNKKKGGNHTLTCTLVKNKSLLIPFFTSSGNDAYFPF